MTPLGALLRRRISETVPVRVSEYMREALGHEEHGYYVKRDPFGLAGDFTTAPEITQIFGELIGAWCLAVWRSMDAPDPIQLVELGPGRGTLLADAGRIWRQAAPELASAARMHLVETSPALRARQQQAMAALSPSPSVEWHLRFADVPAGPMILLANEFFDALPIDQYVRRANLWRERRIGLAGDRFAFVEGRASDLTDTDPEPDTPEGSIRELCPEGEGLAASIGARVAAEGGTALIIDYGPSSSALGDTLQAVCRHHYADPLAEPGAADLSHHVDFERLGDAAGRAGAAPFGPIPQGLFLGRLGIAARAETLAAATSATEHAESIRAAARRLIHPGRMGVLFKAFAIADPRLPTPPGFRANFD